MAINVSKPTDAAGVTLEAWAGGLMTGSLVVMACITFANMKKGVLLHKLIFIELLFGMIQGTSMFPDPPAYGWYLAVGGVFLNISWTMHNVIAWMKNKPFLTKRASMIYIWTIVAVQPYWILEMVAVFLYFNKNNKLFTYTRPWEAAARDPWWLFTSASLFWNIKRRYDYSIAELVTVSPRFGVLLFAMVMSIIFVILDILSVTHVINGRGAPDGINPFWKLAFVFKCLTDTMVLDDFKTALDRLKQYKFQNLGRAATAHRDLEAGAVCTLDRRVSVRVTKPLEPSRMCSGSSRTPKSDSDIKGLEFCTMPESIYQKDERLATVDVSDFNSTSDTIPLKTKSVCSTG